MSIIQLAFDTQHPYQSEIKPKPFDLSCPVCKSDLILDQQGNLVCKHCKEELHFESEKQEKQLQARTYFEKALSLPEAERKELLEKALALFDSLEHRELEDLEAQAFLYEALAKSTRTVEKRLSYYQKAVSILEKAREIHSSPALLFYLACLYNSLGHERLLLADKKTAASFKAAEGLIRPLYKKAKKEKKLLYGRQLEKSLHGQILYLICEDKLQKASALYQELFGLIHQQKKELPEKYEWEQTILQNTPFAIQFFYQFHKPAKARVYGQQIIQDAEKQFKSRQDEKSFETLLYLLTRFGAEAYDFDQSRDFEQLFQQSEDWLDQAQKMGLDLSKLARFEMDLALHAFHKAIRLSGTGQEEEAVEILKAQLAILENRAESLDKELLYLWSSMAKMLYSLLERETHQQEKAALLETLYEIEERKKSLEQKYSLPYMEAQAEQISLLNQLANEYHYAKEERKELETVERLLETAQENKGLIELEFKDSEKIFSSSIEQAKRLDEPQRALAIQKKAQDLGFLKEDYV